MDKVDVTLTQVPGSNGKTTWEMTYGGKKFLPDGYPPIKLPHGTGPYEFTFTIANPGAVTFTSGDGKDSPIYIQETTAKPSVGVVNYQISNVHLKDNNTVLVFKDKNHGAPKTLSYQLNFNGAGPLDPIIENGGGGPPGFQSQYLYGGAAALLLLVAFLVLRNRLAKSRVVQDETGRL
jgi:hypothetical protein